MVKMLRVDERLLHGQVALNWVQYVNASSILIGNDGIMDDEIGKLALKMAKPSGFKMAIRSIEGSAELLNDPRSAEISIFVIVRTIADALRLVKLTGEVKQINIGGVKKKEGGKMVAVGTFVDQRDLDDLRELKNYVDKIEFRTLPSDSAKSVDSILQKEDEK